MKEHSDEGPPIRRVISFSESLRDTTSLRCLSMPNLDPENEVKLMGLKARHLPSNSADYEDHKLSGSYNVAFEKKRLGNDLIPTTFDVNEELQINQTSLGKMSGNLFRQSVLKSILEKFSGLQKHECMTWLPSNPGSYVKDHFSYPIFLRWGIIDHRSQFFYFWNMSSLVTNVLNAIIIPLWCGFYYDGDDTVVSSSFPESFFFVYLLLSTLQMCIDFIVHCNLTYYAPGGRIVCNRQAIVHNYLKSWFLVDFFAGFPYQLFLISKEPPSYGYFELLRLVKFFRILTTDVGFTSFVIQIFMIKYGIRFNLTRVALVRSILLLVIVIHVFACGAYVMSNYLGLDYPWESNVVNRDSISAKYFEAFYWATMTSTTTGFGDLIIFTTELQVYTIFAMLGGAVMWSSIIAVMANVLREWSIRRSSAEKLSDGLSQFVSMIRGDESVRHSLLIHLKRVSEYPSISLSSIHEMLGDLSPSIRALLLLRLHAFWLNTQPFFLAVDDPWYIWHLSHALQSVRCHPDEYLAVAGCQVRRITIIRSGCCIAERKGCLMANCAVGEEMILSQPKTYSDDYRVLIMVEAWILDDYQLKELMDKYPELKKMVRKAALRLAFRLNIRRVLYHNM